MTIGKVRIRHKLITAALVVGTLVLTAGYAQPQQKGDELYQRGKAHFNRGEYTESMRVLKKAIPLLTNYDYIISAHKSLAVIYVAFTRPADAVAEFTEVLKLNPEMLLDPLTESPSVIKAFEEARNDLIKQGIISPDTPPDTSQKEETVTADTPITTVPVEQKPSSEEKIKECLEKAGEYYKQGKYSLAAEKLSDALFEDPACTEAHLLLAKVYYRIKGKHLMAIDEAQKVLAREPDNFDAHNLLANIYFYKTVEYEKAMREIKTVLILDPANARGHDLLGVIYHKRFNYDKSLQEHRTALENNPDLASAYNHLGDNFNKMQRLTDAVIEYEAAVKLEADNLEFIEDLALLYERVGHKGAAVREWNNLLKHKLPKSRQDLALRHLQDLKLSSGKN